MTGLSRDKARERLIQLAAEAQRLQGGGLKEEFAALRDGLVMAALHDFPAVLASLDREEAERARADEAEAALRERR